MSWRVPQVTDDKIELQGLGREFRLWERGVRVFERERESWRVSQVTEHEIELQGVDGEFRLWEKGVRVFERERELESITGYRTQNRASRCRRRDLGVGERGRVFSTERERVTLFFFLI